MIPKRVVGKIHSEIYQSNCSSKQGLPLVENSQPETKRVILLEPN